jgi:hypothetical protein
MKRVFFVALSPYQEYHNYVTLVTELQIRAAELEQVGCSHDPDLMRQAADRINELAERLAVAESTVEQFSGRIISPTDGRPIGGMARHDASTL